MHPSLSVNCRYLGAAAAVVFAVSLSGPLAAEERHGHVHQHGVSKLKLVIDGAGLEMEIVSPGSDIVGFEHPPATADDRQAIEKATAVFRNAGALFVIPPSARCKLVSAEIEAPDHENEKHGQEKHGHGKHQDDHRHDHDKHDDVKSGKGAEHHSEFHGHYRYKCGNPEKLTHIDIKLFDQFPRAREIEVEAITPSGQIARELTPKTARLQL